MSSEHPGPVRRLALRGFRLLPARVGHAVIRAQAPTFSMGAVALLRHDGRVLVLRQLHRTGWSLPGGLVDRGEEPAEAVVREVQEETGLSVLPGDVMATVVSTRLRHIDMIYVIDCDRRPQVRPASEAVAADWFDLDHIPDPDGPTRRILAAVRAAESTPRAGRLVPGSGSPS